MLKGVNHNEGRIMKWKGQTFNQISSFIKKNSNSFSDTNTNYYIAPPLKIYRREIASADMSNCNPRTSARIDEFDRPGGTIVNSNANTVKGLANTLDIHLTNNTTETAALCDSCNETNPVVSPETNARRRVRSSGMIKRQFDVSKNNDSYYTSSNQYLVSRNRTFQQNQYNYLRQGTSTVKPGDALSSSNIYSPNGLNHCQKFYFATATNFQYKWFGTSLNNTVTVTPGYYSLDELNLTLKNRMENNYHYLVNNANYNKLFLINIAYNTFYNKVELQFTAIGPDTINLNGYSLPTDSTWSIPTVASIPTLTIYENRLATALGFSSGEYPSSSIEYTTDQVVLSTFTPGIQPLYVPLYYKPNNPKFASQGAVTSSSLITRKKYDAITNNTVNYMKAYGTALGNALAYGVPANGYTIKDKIGYPNKQTPVFSKYTEGFECLTYTLPKRGTKSRPGSIMKSPLL